MDMIFLDLTLPGIDDLELIRELARRKCLKPIVLMSGVGQVKLDEAQLIAQSLGLIVFSVLNKPFTLYSLESLIERRVYSRSLDSRPGKTPQEQRDEPQFPDSSDPVI
jgi:DNA-binding NtrC family response regulator